MGSTRGALDTEKMARRIDSEGIVRPLLTEQEGEGQPKEKSPATTGSAQWQVPTAALASQLDERVRRSLRSRSGEAVPSGASHG